MCIGLETTIQKDVGVSDWSSGAMIWNTDVGNAVSDNSQR
jgi:hypothetical protein